MIDTAIENAAREYFEILISGAEPITSPESIFEHAVGRKATPEELKKIGERTGELLKMHFATRDNRPNEGQGLIGYEFSEGEIMQKLDRARMLRGLPLKLRHRTYVEFAHFMIDMIRYLVYGEESSDELVAKFQKGINRESYSWQHVQDFRTYVDLFLKYWQSR